MLYAGEALSADAIDPDKARGVVDTRPLKVATKPAVHVFAYTKSQRLVYYSTNAKSSGQDVSLINEHPKSLALCGHSRERRAQGIILVIADV